MAAGVNDEDLKKVIKCVDDGQEKLNYFVSQLDRAIYKIKFELSEKTREVGASGSNVPALMAFVMRELNKVRLGPWYKRTKLDGETKKKIAVTLIEFAVGAFGGPMLMTLFPTSEIVNVLEFIYLAGIHKKKSLR